MPRHLTIGNGQILINLDKYGLLRDVFYPYVGQENHTVGRVCRMGFWVDGKFAWFGDNGWSDYSVGYLEDTLVTHVTARNEKLGIRVTSNDCVDFHHNLYLRKLTVESLSKGGLLNGPREIKVFFHHDFSIDENDVGDTAVYEPLVNGIIHYKGQRYFLISGQIEERNHGFHQFATGIKGFRGAEGTWRDAEDGNLSGNPIAQGSVDSTIGFHIMPSQTLYYWIAIGSRYGEVKRMQDDLLTKGPEEFLKRTKTYWELWVRKGQELQADLDDQLLWLYKRSLLTIRTHIDKGGAILASNDWELLENSRDTYSYVWPRDGACIAYTLDKAGFPEPSQKFFQFCENVISSDGYFFHKYNADGSLASSWHPWFKDGEKQLPIQEDETALVIWALWHHFARYRDLEFIKPLYRRLITRPADFLAGYRDKVTGLPLPSWDLWEERRGVHTFTVSTVYAGLQAAANFTEALGENERTTRYRTTAEEIKQAMEQFLWQPQLNRFARSIYLSSDGRITDIDTTVDASLAGIFLFGVYPATDPKVVQTMEAVKNKLWVRTPIGGVARYENDPYHRVTQQEGVPGNPWFICTMWLAQWEIAKAQTHADLQAARELLRWVQIHALPSGLLPEQLHPLTGEPLSVAPLMWSHAAFVDTVKSYEQKWSELATMVCLPVDQSSQPKGS